MRTHRPPEWRTKILAAVRVLKGRVAGLREMLDDPGRAGLDSDLDAELAGELAGELARCNARLDSIVREVQSGAGPGETATAHPEGWAAAAGTEDRHRGVAAIPA